MHVCFAVMIGLPMSRLVAALAGEGRVGAVPAVDHVRRRRHRQPLLHRRVPGRVTAGSRRCWPTAARPGQAGRLGLRPRHGPSAVCPSVAWSRPPERSCPAADGRPADQAAAGAAGPLRRPRARCNGADDAGAVRERLIESRLTPNAISLTGLCAEPGAAGLMVGRGSSSPGSRSSSARSWTRWTAATRGCRARAPRLGRSWTRRSTGSRRDRADRGRRVLRLAHNQVRSPRRWRRCLSLMVSYTRARAEALAWSARSASPRARSGW